MKNNMLDKVMDDQKQRYKDRKYEIGGFIIYSLISLIVLLKAIALSYKVSIDTIIYYNNLYMFILFSIVMVYGLLALYMRQIKKMYTLILISLYFIFSGILNMVDGLERYAFPILALLGFVYISYTIIDIFLDYNIFKPIKKYFIPEKGEDND